MAMFSAFVDEMQKLAASKDRMSIPKARSGRRSMSVETVLKKEKDGSLFKKTAEGRARDAHFAKQADAIGIESENGRTKYLHGDEAEKAMEGINQSLGAMTDPIFTGIRHMFSHGELEGGIAERAGKEPQDFDPYELAKGIQDEEEEHTNDLATARQIAMDHLVKHPLYYEELPKMEEKLTEEEEAQGLSAKQPEREKEAWAKLADSWKPQWLELNSAPNDYFMQNTNVVMGKKARGDAPSMQEGLTEGQASRTPASYAQPTNCALAMKDASAHWSKIAKAVMGPQVRSPTDTVPDVEGPPNRMQRQEDRNFFIGPSSDAQPITGTSTDAYSRN